MRHYGLYPYTRRLISLAASKSLLILFSFLLLGIWFPQRAIAQGFCLPSDKPTIIYTGKTYGYLRDKDHRLNSGGEKSVGDAFAATYDYVSQECPQAILVGMGDNFAPDYGARYTDFDLPRCVVGKSATGTCYDPNNPTPVSRLDPNAWSTNHAVLFFKNFSDNQHYDALVPGQLDFYFGATFLWHVGQQLPMLGANLMIKISEPDVLPQPQCGPWQLLLPTQVSLPAQSGSGSSGGGKGKSGGKKGQGGSGQGSSGSSSSQSSSGQSGQLCLQARTQGGNNTQGAVSLLSPSPSSVYPWTTEFEVSLPAGLNDLPVAELAAQLCPSGKPCTPLSQPIMIPPRNQSTSVTYLLELDPHIPIESTNGTLHNFGDAFPDVKLCVQKKNDSKTQKCTTTPIHVQTPLFPHVWVEACKDRTHKDQSNCDETNKNKINYVIFGALDPAIQGLISPENSSWGDDKQYTAQINIYDPAAPLEQLVVAFQKLHPNEKWTYVLLAQMPPAQARVLAATLQYHQDHPPSNLPHELRHTYHFDVILSAADSDQATPDMKLTLDQEQAPTPVITPHPIVFEKTMRNPLEVLEIGNSYTNRPKYTNYTDDNVDHVIRDECDEAKDTFKNACDDYTNINLALDAQSDRILPNIPHHSPPCNLSSSFQCLALQKMRDALDTDAALLQHRDFYDKCNYEGPIAGPVSTEMAERVLWNSGYLTRASVSGATLRAIMQASDRIAATEKSSTSSPLEYGADLVYLGITKSDGLYYIDGAALEDSKIYAIATSDQLALGDSAAYPQFSQVDLVSPTVFTNLRSMRDKDATLEIAQIASHSLVPSSALCEFQRNDLVAEYNNLPVMPSPPKGPKPSPDPFERAGPVEVAVQHRNFLTMTLQQASIGYTNSKPSQTDANINHNLAGVTNPNVASPHSDNLSYGDWFRLMYEWTDYWNVGLDQIITFARGRQGSLTQSAQTTPTGQPIPPESINLSANTLIVSPFIELQTHRYHGHFGVVARPVTFSSGLSRTLQFLPTKTTGVEYELNLRRQENWQPSVGARYEWNNLNFFETGYLHQTARNVVSALTVNGITTPLTAGTTVSEVANITPNPGDVAIPTYATFHQQGAYWLGMYTHRLSRNAKSIQVTYQGTTYGNFLAYGASARTSTALTRYAAELGNSIQIQLWGNISLAPSYNIFWFQDQSHGIGDSLTRRDWNIQLNYLFDWHQGLEWRYALEGKTGQ